MKIETQPRDDHQVTLIVELEQDRLEGAKRRAARKLARRTKIPGFRPGKAPYDVVRLHIGDTAITEEAVDILIDEVYPKALDEAKLEPAAPGALENVDSLEPPKFTFVVPLKPVVELGDYKSLRAPYEWKPPSEEDVGKAVEEMRRAYATTAPVERVVEEGDYVLVDIRGEKAKADEGEDPLVVDRKNHAVFVAPEKREDEFPFAGFARKLIGLSAGDAKSISHKFPKDAEDESLRGATVRYEVEVKAVHGMELPELDDEFAKTVGAGETLEELREAVRKNLESKSREEYDDGYFADLIDKIKEGATIKYPPQVLDHEAGHVLDDLKQRLAQQGMEIDAYLKMQQTDLEKFIEEEIRPVAAKRLERSLIFDELALAENIEVDEEDLQAEFGQTLIELQYQGYDLNKIRGGRRAQKEIAELIAMQSANRLITRRTLERIKAIATGEAEKEEQAAKKAARKAAKEAAGSAEGEEGKPKKAAKKASAAKKPEKKEKAAPKKKGGARKTTAGRKPAAKKSSAGTPAADKPED